MKLSWKIFGSRNLDSIIDIADQYVFHGDIEKIIEVTYTYREIGENLILNETLFEEYTKMAYPETDIINLGRICKYKLQFQVLVIEKIIKKTQKLRVCSRADSLRRGMFIDALNYTCIVLGNAIAAITFELEKAGVTHSLSLKQVTAKIQEIEKREKELFGEKVIQNSEEFSACYNFVLKNHLEKQDTLSEKDKRSMDEYLRIIKKASLCHVTKTLSVKPKVLEGDFFKIQIERKDYRKVFDLVCELYNLPQRTKLTNAASIYDGDKFLEIPRNEAHSVFTIERLLKLLTHEIESHYINSFNGQILIGNFRGSKNLPKEEGLAMFMEKIFRGHNYDSMDNIVKYFFTIMVGESLKGEDFEDFMRIMGKEYECKRNYVTSVRRAKRNYSFSYSGVQHKDVVYFRGLTELLGNLKKGHQFTRLFLGKVGFHDVDNLYDISLSHPRKDELVFPVFISDLVYYYFAEKEKDADFNFQAGEYYLYLKEKYWFIDIENFYIIPYIEKKWKKIEKILKLFERTILDKN